MVNAKDKILSDLEKDWKKNTIKAYKESRENIKKVVADMMEKGIDSQLELMRYNRLKSLDDNIQYEIGALTGITTQELESTLVSGYKKTSDYITEDIVSKVPLNFSILDTKEIKGAILNPLDNVGFIQREKNNMAVLINNLNSEIARGIIQGQGYKQIANNVNDRMNIGYNNSLRIVRTESHRVTEKATMDRVEEAKDKGVNIKKKWLATRGERTREAHSNANGQVREVNEAFDVGGEKLMYPGDPSGSAGNVIHCRCTMIYEIDI